MMGESSGGSFGAAIASFFVIPAVRSYFVGVSNFIEVNEAVSSFAPAG
jgi:hypothetical protein